MPATQAQSAVPPPATFFDGSLAETAKQAEVFFRSAAQQIKTASGETRSRLVQENRETKEAFFRRHATAMYAEITGNMTRQMRIADLVYAGAERFPALLPTRAQIDAERALRKQFAKEGHEIDQGLFVAHVLADERCGLHLIHAMMRPKRQAQDRLAEFIRTGVIDLGSATVERKGNIGYVTLTNANYLNAEDDAAMAALETAVDLVLLDDRIQAGVLRGGIVQHPKHFNRRIFNAGINLTHLYFGQISFVEFILERELGLLNKIYRGHSHPDRFSDQLEDTIEKPWLAVVDSFAIGGGCQLLCVMDRVIAEPGAYFNLPASKEGFVPGAANLRLPRLVGITEARHGIFFEKKFYAGTPEGMMICDEAVPASEMDAAIERNTKQMLSAGFTSTVSNRKALRIGEEPWDAFRRYQASYARQQAFCFYDLALIANLEHSWQPQKRRI